MTEKAMLYFVLTKVIAPKNSRFHLILSVEDITVVLSSPKSRSSAYTIPYKVKKEIFIHPEENPSYNIQIIFFEGEKIKATGSVRLNPKNFLNSRTIELKQYDLQVPKMDNISVFVGMTLVPLGGAYPQDFDIYGDSARVITTSDYIDQSNSDEPSVEGQMEGLSDIVRSESGQAHRRRRGTVDVECVTFESQGGRIHRRHKHARAPQGQPEGAEEVVQSESGKSHRRKKGTADARCVTFISESGRMHRMKRSAETEGGAAAGEREEAEKEENAKPAVEGQMEGQSEIIHSESGRPHRRRRGTADVECVTFESQSGNVHRRRHTQDPQGEPAGAEDVVESESGESHLRKKGTVDTRSVTFTSESGHVHRHRRRHTQEEGAPEEGPSSRGEGAPDSAEAAGGKEEAAEGGTEEKKKRRRRSGKKEGEDGAAKEGEQEHRHRKRRKHDEAH